MARPIIGITGELEAARWRTWIREAVVSPVSYTRAVERAGGTPVVLPPVPSSSIPTLIARLDGLLVAGGRDMDPSLYDEAPHDQTDLPDRLGNESHRPEPVKITTHDVQISPGSALAGIIGVAAAVPAAHHQAINRLGTGLTTVAWTEDKVIEAVELAGHRFGVGVQWHPEEGDDARIFEAFVNAAKAAPVPQPSPVPAGQAVAVGQSAADVASRAKRTAKRPAARR